MDAEQLLERAENICRGYRDDLLAHGPTFAAFLARRALEQAVVDRLEGVVAGAASARMNTRLACLKVVDQQRAHRALLAWTALSSMCHVHAFRLQPSAAEVLDAVALVRAVRGSGT